jgi:Transposase DDE domain group 1
MQTECNSRQLEFQGVGRRGVVGKFDGGNITSEAGGLLLREVDDRLKISKRCAGCFTDYRNAKSIEHEVEALVRQRIYGIALGYEDLNDHDDLRSDPLLAVLCGKEDPTGSKRKDPRDRGKALAGKSTLNRMELTEEKAEEKNRYKKIKCNGQEVDELLVDLFLDSFKRAPRRIILDVDATDDVIHGNQEGRFFHGYYKNYCYLPLYIFCEEQLLCARLRPSNIDASEGTVEELERIVFRIRQRWPEVQIVVRGDSGFCREKIMAWCEQRGVEYILGLAKNSRLQKILHEDLVDAQIMYATRGKASRIYREFVYQTRKSWSKPRRVIGKAEYLSKGANPRFVVTSLSGDEMDVKKLYEKMYCARGEMENRIKEQQLYMFADRTSTSKMRSNQIRLYFSSLAYILVNALRRFGLKNTELAKAQCHTIRLKLFKIGAQVRVTVRKIWVSFAEGYPYKDVFFRAFANLKNT